MAIKELTTYTVVIDNLTLPLYEYNFSAPNIKLKCNTETLDNNPNCNDCY